MAGKGVKVESLRTRVDGGALGRVHLVWYEIEASAKFSGKRLFATATARPTMCRIWYTCI